MCGVIGIYNKNNNNNNHNNHNNLLKQLINGIINLKHRGRNGYGITVKNDETYLTYKNTNNINRDEILNHFKNNKNGNMGIAHTRYSTSYKKNKISTDLCQPFKGVNKTLGEFFVVHNGHINFPRRFYEKYGDDLNDSQLIIKVLEEYLYNDWKEVIKLFCETVPGVYSLIIMSNYRLYALKDMFGLRPLCVGKNKLGYCVTSESIALGDYSYLYELNGGELAEISDYGVRRFTLIKHELNKCLFEYIYFLKGDSKITEDINVNSVRYMFGNELARKERTNIVDKTDILVVGSPDTGIQSGIGFSEALDLEYCQFVIKNKMYGRSFILDSDESRREECKNKMLIDKDIELENKIIYFIDDSIVRGNTMKTIVKLLKDCKVREIHIRIASPMIKDICQFGIDIPTREELIMNKLSIDEFIKEYAIDSLVFLNIDEIEYVMKSKLNLNNNEICTGCFTSNYKKELLEW
tara:strand:+ start:2444 stop:3841 length:1398 start_codon:yes stop_codon:yes gene_type:complete